MDAIRSWLYVGKYRETRNECELAALGINDVPYLDSASLAELL
jgi:hypothetical protein